LPAAASTKANPTATDAGFDELSLDPYRGSCLTAVHAIQLLGLKVAGTSGWRTGSPSIISSLQESLVQSDTI